MDSIAHQPPVRRVAIGIDTHKHLHVAVALDELGGRLGELTVSADSGGHVRVERWATGFGRILAFGIEGTSSYGAGVTSHLHRQGHRVIEVNRPDRRERRLNGKSDTLDAENAARAVLSGRATATPKAADGEVEMIRQIKIAKDTAVKARTQAMVTLKTLVVTAPPEVREQLDGLSKMALIERCAGLRPGPMTTPLAATKQALRGLARRWRQLQVEIKEHERHLATLTESVAPAMVGAFGIGPDTAAEMLIAAGDNVDRVRSEPAWAKLCGVCPVPASSGKTSRHRLNRGGHRQANAALYRTVIVRLCFHQPTIDYVAPDCRGQDEGGDHPPSEALRGPRGLGVSAPCTSLGAAAGTGHLTTIGASTARPSIAPGQVISTGRMRRSTATHRATR